MFEGKLVVGCTGRSERSRQGTEEREERVFCSRECKGMYSTYAEGKDEVKGFMGSWL